MIDFFELLDEPRHPWLDADALKDKFAALSTTLHPDKFPNAAPEEKERIGARFAQFNEAYITLSDTRKRLHHLIGLENGTEPTDVQRIPPGFGDLFMKIGQTCAEAKAFAEKRKKTELENASPMIKAKLFVENMEWSDRLVSLQEDVQKMQADLEDELRQMNRFPDNAQPLPIARLEEIYRSMSYIIRWTEQIRETSVLLAV